MARRRYAVILTAVLSALIGLLSPSITVARTKITHEVSFNVVIFRGSEWSKEEVVSRLLQAEKIYSRCGVRFGEISLSEIDPPGGYVDLVQNRKFQGLSGSLRTAGMLPPHDKLLFIYVRSSISEDILIEPPLAWTATEDMVPLGSPLLGKMWVTKAAATKVYYHRDFSPEAHELGHILLPDANHVRWEKNLMGDSLNTVNGKLSKAQCAKIRQSPFVHELPKR